MESTGLLTAALEARWEALAETHRAFRERMLAALADGSVTAAYGPEHWHTVETLVARMIPERILGALSGAELRLLIEACIAHDLRAPGRGNWGWLLVEPQRWGLDQAFAGALRRVCEISNDISRLSRAPRWLYLDGHAVDVQRVIALLHVAVRLDVDHTDCPPPAALGELTREQAASWPRDLGLAVGLIDSREGHLRLDMTVNNREWRRLLEREYGPYCEAAINAVRNVLLAGGMPYREIELRDLHARPSADVLMAQQAARAKQGTRRKPKRPFKFLDPFEEDEPHLLAARDDDTIRLCGRALTSPLTVLTGEVGVGKTSLVAAGVLPWLREHGYDGVLARCLNDPAQALLDAVRRRLGDDAPTSLAEAVAALAAQGEGRVLLVLDQAQELFTRLGSQTRLHFAEQMASLLSLPGDPAHVVLVVQREFFYRLGELLPVLPTIYGEVVELGRLTREQAVLVIHRALGRFRLRFDELLITHVVDDLATVDGVLPVELQVACEHLFEQVEEDETRLGYEVYRKVGPARRALETLIDSRLRTLWWRRPALAKSILVDCVTAQRTKALLTAEECSLDIGADLRTTRELLEALCKQRLLRRLKLGARTFFELRHEYLAQWLEPYISDVERQAKDVDDLLHRELNNYEQFQLLLDREKLKLVHQFRRRLVFTPEELDLLIRSAATERFEVDYWFGRAGELALSQQMQLCVDLLYAPEPELRDVLSQLIRRLDQQAVIPTLLASLREAEPAVRDVALTLLAASDQPLVQALSADDPATQQQAAYALGQIGAVSAVPTLVESAQSAQADEVRETAVEALAELDRTRSTELLIRSLRSGNEQTRWNAAMALGRLGRDAGVRERLKREAERREVGASLLFAYTRACVEGLQFDEAERLLKDLERRAVPDRQRPRLAQAWADLQRQREAEQRGVLAWPMYRGSAGGEACSSANFDLPLELKWEFATGDLICSSPAVAGGTVFIGSDDGSLHALDTDSGQPRWACPLAAQVRSTPCVLDGSVFIAALDGSVHAVAADTGRVLWQRQFGSGLTGSIRGDASCLAAGTVEGELVGFDPHDGHELWRQSLGGTIAATPALAGGQLVVGTDEGGLVLVDARSGEICWRRPIDGGLRGSPVLLGHQVIVGSGDGRLVVLERASGEPVWSASLRGAVGGSPAVAHGRIYLGGADGEIACFDQANGARVWSFDTGGEVSASPAVAGGAVFVGTQAGQLYALGSRNGEPLWRYRTGYSIYSTPAIAEGRLFVALRYYNICAFAEPSAVESG